MTRDEFPIGELVVISTGEYESHAGVISWPVTKNNIGYVLICLDGKIAGVKVSYTDIKSADASSQGFTQLSYGLKERYCDIAFPVQGTILFAPVSWTKWALSPLDTVLQLSQRA